MRILIATDAWAPQVNGVVITLAQYQRGLEAGGPHVETVGPDRFRSIPCPTYPEIRLALLRGAVLAEVVDAFRVRMPCTSRPKGRSAWLRARCA